MPRDGLPSFRVNVSAVGGVSWQLAHATKLHRRRSDENCYNRGLPFLDRNFLEFMFAIPRDQVLRPGKYRSLMRRSLAGIIPHEILNRTRKAFAARRSALRFQAAASGVRKLFAYSISGKLGWVNSGEFLKSLSDLIEGKNDFIVPVRNTVVLEIWLHSLSEHGLLKAVPAGLGAKALLEVVA